MTTDVKEASRNPKKIQCEARKQVLDTGIVTKSQQTLKLQQEQLKTERKVVSRGQREAEKERKLELKQQKRKRSIRAGDTCLYVRGGGRRMNKRYKKKSKSQVVKYEYNSISQDCMIKIQAEAYYRALKRIEQEKSELEVPVNNKKLTRWYMKILLMLNVFFCPWRINKYFRINDQIYDNILVAFVSAVLQGFGGMMWIFGIIGTIYDVYKIITLGVSVTLMIFLVIAMLILFIGSTFVISGDKFSQESDSYKIYAYSASIIALVSCVVSAIALLIKI